MYLLKLFGFLLRSENNKYWKRLHVYSTSHHAKIVHIDSLIDMADLENNDSLILLADFEINDSLIFPNLSAILFFVN